jgi:hypothetical protein
MKYCLVPVQITLILLILVGCSKQQLDEVTVSSTENHEYKQLTYLLVTPTTELKRRSTATLTETIAYTNTFEQLPSLWKACKASSNNVDNCIKELMQNNYWCKFPCWWGIIPGKYPIQTIINTINELSSDFKPVIDDKVMTIDITYSDSMDTIQFEGENAEIIHLDSIKKGETSINTYNKIYQLYLPSSILLDYGKPSSIFRLLSTYFGFKVYFVFEQYNFVVIYTIDGYYKLNNGYYICPERENRMKGIERLEYISAKNSIPILEIIKKTFTKEGYNESDIISIETKNIENYYSDLKIGKGACLEIGGYGLINSQ